MFRGRVLSRWKGKVGRDKILQVAGAMHDILAALFAFYAAYVVYYDMNAVLYSAALQFNALFFVLSAGISFSFFSLNSGAWQYASLPDLTAIIKASLTASAFYAVGELELPGGSQFAPMVIPLIFIFLVCALGGPRLAYRVVKERGYLEKLTGRPAVASRRRYMLLIGVNSNAENFIRTTRRSARPDVRICGFVDESARIGMAVQGVKVLGRHADIGPVIGLLRQRGMNVSELVVTSHDVPREKINELISIATAHGLKTSRIPDISCTAVLKNKPIVPNPIEIADLLGRPEVYLDAAATSKFLASKAVLITGAGGSIGSELARQVASFNPSRIVLTDVSEYLLFMIDREMRERFPGIEIVSRIADIRDYARIDGLMQRQRPDVVFHAAALKHVPMMEDNILESIKTNTLGARNLADCSLKNGVGCFVLISTDKAVNPTNVMGATKRVAEAYCQSLDRKSSTTRFKTVRFGNVLGSLGSVVPLFKEQIGHGGPVTITHPDIVRYFMTIQEAARLVLKASAHQLENGDDRGRIHVLNMGEPVRISDLAAKMIELAGYRPHIDIDIIYTKLRPGEKLREELFAPEEHAGIIIEDGFLLASARHVDPAVISNALAGLQTAIDQGNELKAIHALRTIVPEYQPARMPSADLVHIDTGRRISA